ncbi:MAG: hypothetical protein MUO19_08280 [Dehalococcoidales bacterium]|nr:hypothetical protein [Dehalococcoidales bacterium]
MARIQAIQPGYCVAVHLTPNTAPECCYVGMVEVTDDIGILINLVHWDDKLDMVGGYSESLFVPWTNINSMLISTEQQPTRRFMTDRAPRWKAQVEALAGEGKAAAKKK